MTRQSVKSKFAWKIGTTKMHNKENAKKPSSSKRIQMFYRMMLMISKTPLPVCTVKFSRSTVSPCALLSGLTEKYVSSELASSVLIWERRVFVCESCKQMQL